LEIISSQVSLFFNFIFNMMILKINKYYFNKFLKKKKPCFIAYSNVYD
jgi:hypothetical protein